jgi:hypothetical protein
VRVISNHNIEPSPLYHGVGLRWVALGCVGLRWVALHFVSSPCTRCGPFLEAAREGIFDARPLTAVVLLPPFGGGVGWSGVGQGKAMKQVLEVFEPEEFEGQTCGIVASLLKHLGEGEHQNRILRKFLEKDYQKIERSVSPMIAPIVGRHGPLETSRIVPICPFSFLRWCSVPQ